MNPWARCTDFRSRTRTSPRPKASAPPTAHRSSRDHVPDVTRSIVESDQGRRRADDRQDQHAGVRRRLADVQPGLRRHPQPLRPDQDLRRQQRRRGRGAGAAACCRSPTAATWAARCAIRRTSATWSASGPRWAACRSGRAPTRLVPLRCRADGAHGRRRGAACCGVLGRTGPASPLSASRARQPLRRAAGAGFRGASVAWSRRPGRSAGRPERWPRCDGPAPGTVLDRPRLSRSRTATPDISGADEVFRTWRAW